MRKSSTIEYVTTEITNDPEMHKLNAGVLKRSDLEKLAENVNEEIYFLLKYGSVAVMNLPREI